MSIKYSINFKTTFVISRCKTLTINVDKRWFNVIKHYYEKILVDILRKYSLIFVKVLLISYLYFITLFYYYFINVFTMVIEHFSNTFIVNVFHNIFQCFLIEFDNSSCLLGGNTA